MTLYYDALRDVAVPGPQREANMDALLLHMWDESLAEHSAVIDAAADLHPMLWPILHAALARSDRPDQLRVALAHHPLPDLAGLWSSTWTHCWEAEAAAAAGDAARAARVLPLLRPLAGRMCVAGIAIAQGPVDGYLALAAATAGERDEARRHGDVAERLARDWGLDRYLDWLRERRADLGF